MNASPRFGFPRQYRLLKTDGFSSVFAFRKALKSEHFQLNYRPGVSVSPRLGVVVAKKLARRAVQRNRVKRQAREAFRQARPGLPHVDVVVRLTKSFGADDGSTIRGEIESLFNKLPR